MTDHIRAQVRDLHTVALSELFAAKAMLLDHVLARLGQIADGAAPPDPSAALLHLAPLAAEAARADVARGVLAEPVQPDAQTDASPIVSAADPLADLGPAPKKRGRPRKVRPEPSPGTPSEDAQADDDDSADEGLPAEPELPGEPVDAVEQPLTVDPLDDFDPLS